MHTQYLYRVAFSIVLCVFFSFPTLSQTTKQTSALQLIATQQRDEWQSNRTVAESLAVKLGMPIRKEFPDGRVIELQRFENGAPIYYTTHNLNAAKTISTDKVWTGGSAGLSLSGSGVTLGLWDVGKVLESHQELTGRVTFGDAASTYNTHSTHVAGTMIASGVSASAKGMSYQGNLSAYDWNNDLSEMASAAAAGLNVSNHSYGNLAGWVNNYFGDGKWAWLGVMTISTTEDYTFGFYNLQSRQIDLITYNAPNYLVVKSAGNERSETGPAAGTQHWHFEGGSWVLATDVHEPDGGTDGYDCIADYGIAKNSLTIGAVNDITTGYTGPSSVVISSFSSWGPTDDGRIKPDLVANGVGLTSSLATANNAYGSYSGTSMAAPNVSGSLGLLLQHQKNLNSNTLLLSSTLKAIVIHTADEAGSNPGPDYKFGWGLMNTAKAAQVMTVNKQNGGAFNIREATVSQGGQIQFDVDATGSEPLRATLVWTDPPATVPPAALNATTKMLLNDLDIRIISSGGTTYYPWILDPANPSAAATTGDNTRDNVEQILIQSPPAGKYTVRVNHKGTLTNGSQTFALVLTGALPVAVTPPSVPTLASPADGSTGQSLTPSLKWNSAANAVTYEVQVSTTADFSAIVSSQTGISDTLFVPSGLLGNTQYFWHVRSVNSAGTSAYSSSRSFTTANPPPAAPTLSSPSNGATGVSTSPALSWNASSGASSYNVQVSLVSDFSTQVVNQTGIATTNLNISGLAGNTVYYWHVSATNSGGTGDFSTTFSFTTVGTPPSAPTLASPDSGATDIPTSTTLTWNSSVSATSYGLQVATDAGFSSLVVNLTGLTSTSRSVSGLSNNTLYYWRVNASNGSGTSAYSSVRTFTTIIAAPQTPTLVSPADAAVLYTPTPTLTWNSVPNAASYRIQVSTKSNFSTTVIDVSDLADVNFTISGITLTPGTVHYWRVSATNSGGSSTFSLARSFTVNVPLVPALVSPAANATGVSIPPTLTWNSSAGAATYQVQVATSSAFSTIVVDQSGTADTLLVANGLSSNTQYYWRVRASNNVGTSSYSSSRSFITATLPPSVPTLVSPADGATGVSVTPTLSWNTSSGATSYTVQVSTASDFSSFVINQSGVAQTSYSASGLSNNTQYFWRVSASNAGGSSAFSSSRNFTTVVSAPSAPTLVSPADAATGVSVTPTLSWNSVSGALSYRVQISTASNFSALVVNQTGVTETSYNASGLSNSTQYYWRVSAFNASGEGPFSTSRTFTTIVVVPSAPTLTSPADGATGISVTPTLSWNTSSGAASYAVQISTSSDFTNLVVNQSGITQTTYNASGLSNNTQYFWRVNASNAGGTSSFSTARSFTTIVAVPTAPLLASPADAATGVSVTPTFSWNSVPGALSYSLQVSAAANFSSLVVDQTDLPDTIFAASGLQTNTQYYWRVSASNNGGDGAYSTVRSFTTVITPPDIPLLSSPADSATGVSTSPTFSWSSVSGATSYHLQVSELNNFTILTKDQTGIVTTSVGVSGLNNSTQYYWRVSAVNAGGEGSFSASRTFTTVITTPSVPVLASPANAATDISTSPTLSWEPASGAVSYNLQVSTVSNFSSTVYNQTGITDVSFVASGLANNTLHYWKVSATNSGGTSAFSSVRTFTTVPGPPSAPTLSSPNNNANGVSLPVTLQWNASATATSYSVQLSTVSNFSTIAYEQSGIATTSVSVGSILNNTQYYWRVNASNAGGTGAYSSSRRFTTIVGPPVATAATSITTSSFNANWNSVSGATSYRVDVSTDSFTTYLSGYNNKAINSGVTVAVTGLTPGTLYSYRVRSVNSQGTSINSNIVNVVTVSSAPTAAAATSITSTGFTANWNAVAGAASYRLDVATNNTFTSLVTGYSDLTVNTTSQSVTGLTSSTTYYYRVRAVNSGGTSSNSNTISVTTSGTAPDVPTLVSPLDGATGVSIAPTLSWNASSGATSYTVQVSVSADFSTKIVDSNLTATSINVTGLTNNTVYHWRVSATNISGTSAFSSSRSFTTIIAVPSVPTLVSPADGATGVSVSPTLSWNSSAGAESYTIQVSVVSDFSTKIVDSNLTATSVALSGLSNNTQYFWKVSATNAGGTSAFSSVRSFITIKAIPAIPILVSPADSAVNVPLTVTMIWRASADAEHYTVQGSVTSNFTVIVADSVLADTSLTVGPLQENTRYFWRVNASNSGGTSLFSVVRTFVTEKLTSVRMIGTRMPKEYALEQNFPNPFNPSTTIRFALPQRSFVEIKLYDMMGRELSTVLSQEQEAGEYQIAYGAANLSSGVYIYSMTAVSTVEGSRKVMRMTKKMILMK